MKTYPDIIQGSDEWHKIRSTRITASNFHKLFMKETTKTYQNVINEVVFARLTGEVEEGYQSEWMKRGNELEPEAIEAYEFQTFNKVDRIGFVELDENVGCSPDGLIGTDGMIQVKCPKASTLMDYYGEEDVYEPYYLQIQGELYVTGRKWSDYFVYHPNLKPLLKRVVRSEGTISDIKTKLDQAIKLIDKRYKELKRYQ